MQTEMKKDHNLNNKNPMISIILLVVLMFSSFGTYAQDGKSSSSVSGPLTDMYVVLGVGAAGAILGLSTLSFTDQPTKNFRNVSMGGAIGIIVGVGIVILNQATKSSSEIYSQGTAKDQTPESFAQDSRTEFTQKKVFDQFKMNETVSFNFSF